MKTIHRLLLLVFLVTCLSGIAYAQTFEFDNCGAEKMEGPDPGDCEYSDHDVDIIGDGIQVWEVPSSGEYRIKAAGASGGGTGSADGGEGALIESYLDLEEGEKLRMLVGQHGVYVNDDQTSSGGGGTFVTQEVSSGDTMFDGQDVKPLVVAGGGGGDYYEYNSDRTGQTHTSGARGAEEDGDEGLGGSNGHGGECAPPSTRGFGSGGFLTGNADENTVRGGDCNDERGGNSFLSGGLGGEYEGSTADHGGFGGGGSARSSSYEGGGGGGGYSGGGGAGCYSTGNPCTSRTSSYAGGGGGGSFLHASVENPATSDGNWDTTGSEPHDVYTGSVDDLNEWNEGHGYVEIELIEAADFCNFRGPVNECIMNQTNQLQEQEYNVSSIFEARDNAVFEAFNGPATLSLENTTRISGLWRGEIKIESEQPRLEAGASFRPENERIVIRE